MNRKIGPKKTFARILLLFVLFGLGFSAHAAAARSPGSGNQDWRRGPAPRLVVQFAPESGLQMGPDGLRPVPQSAAAQREAEDHLARVEDLVTQMAPGQTLQMRLPTAAVLLGKAGNGPDPAPLTRYAHFTVPAASAGQMRQWAARLTADPAIVRAWPEPQAIPAVLDFGEERLPPGFRSGPAPADTASGSFVHLQGYLGSAPVGIGALDMRLQAGALGAGLTVIDVEGGWLWSHEDLPAPVAQIGAQLNVLSWRNHGTAVVGVIRGQDNGLGVTGIVPACDVGHSSIGSQAVSEAILAAAAVLAPGDVIVIELHAAGPEATGSGQEGYVPMEFWQDNFEAIEFATRQGIIVVEAAGNGQVDLDSPVYEGLFDPALRHSGAIMVGATNGSALDPAWFTNHGQRVDLNGWGFNVTTLAYGDLQGNPVFAEAQWYTAQFNGTSSATPIVTGAVVSLNGMVRARHGFGLDARLARDLLRATGSPANGPQQIGARPDLVAAYALADTGIGQVSGVVTDVVSGLPVAGAVVAVAGLGAAAGTATAADGSWRLPLLTGPVTLHVAEFNYQQGEINVTVLPGGTATADLALVPLDRVDVTGTAYGNGQPLVGARVRPLGLPLPAVMTGPEGAFVIPSVPVGKTGGLLIYGVPGFGARVMDLSTIGAVGTVVLNPVLSPVSEDFGTGDGGFTSSQGYWTHGTPPPSTPGAFTGSQCWGIGQDGLGYADDQADTLTSPLYDLSGVEAGPYFLSFHYFSDTEGGYDGVNLAVSTGGAFTLLAPVEGYPDRFLGGVGQGPGWSGTSPHWTGTAFDIGAQVGGDLQFRLVFGSDGGVTGNGFFVDAIAFGRGLSASAIAEDIPAAPARAALAAWPNPFNPHVTIAWAVSRPGPLEVSVFDLRGRRLARLLRAPVGDTSGTLSWDGQDDNGRGCASGVYLVQLKSGAGERAVQRITLAR